jgi:hypothetical protein
VKLLAYGTIAVVTAPIWVPVAFVGYVGYKVARWSFRHPNIAASTLVAAGLLWYATQSSHVRRGVRETLSRAVQSSQKVKSLEEDLKEAHVARAQENTRSQERERALGLLRQELETYKHAARVDEPRTEHTAHIEAMTNIAYNFYYAKLGDSLSSIAAKVSGSAENYPLIMQDNGLTGALIAGQLLRIRKELCTQQTNEVFARVPRLASVLLPGSVRISEHFKDPAATLELNRHLGLNYADRFPYPQGARIVYYAE